MIELGRNLKLLKEMKSANALLDSSLLGLCLFEYEGKTTSALEFMPRKGVYRGRLLLILSGIILFDFYYSNNDIFYNIERYKFFQQNDGRFYLSLDPFDESEEALEDDRGLIVAQEIIGMLVEPNDDRQILPQGLLGDHPK